MSAIYITREELLSFVYIRNLKIGGEGDLVEKWAEDIKKSFV